MRTRDIIIGAVIIVILVAITRWVACQFSITEGKTGDADAPAVCSLVDNWSEPPRAFARQGAKLRLGVFKARCVSAFDSAILGHSAGAPVIFTRVMRAPAVCDPPATR